ncbi:MAG: ABC transporter permease [Rhodospirillales bacterium]|nr:MAG: ABC transporter permease [Rhodospirillales bacterium]
MPSIMAPRPVVRALDHLGRRTAGALAEIGLAASLVAESFYWLLVGRRRRQPVRASALFRQMMEIGIRALPIVAAMAATIGIMLAIQGIHTLRAFGAETQVTLGIALSMTREFAPLITGIMVAGRSGSALAARLGTMRINQEIDALTVMGISPVRFLVAPALFACLIIVPCLTVFNGFVGLAAAGLYVSVELGMSLAVYAEEVLTILSPHDVLHGLGKSVIFALLIAVIGVVNGLMVSGGAEGVGRATTRAVVQSISAIVITDMLFVFVVTR